MKKLTTLGLIILGSLTPLYADYQKGNQSFTFSFGPSSYASDYAVNNGDDKLRDCGAGAGLQYLYFVHQGPALAIGPDILWTDFSEEDPSGVISGGRSKSDAHTAIYQAITKLVYPSGHWRPYVIGGIGASRASLQSHITEPAGTVQQTFDSVRYGFAGTWGIGLDIFPRQHWFLGLEFRQVILSRLQHTPTQAGAALGIEPTRDPSSITNLMLKVGYKFGAN